MRKALTVFRPRNGFKVFYEIESTTSPRIWINGKLLLAVKL